jgi:7 transmembrane sweet-taste receptor of 3 GCPR
MAHQVTLSYPFTLVSSLHTGVQSGASLAKWVYLGQIAPPQTLGVLGQETWFITKFTVEQDPSLAIFLGLQGEEKRQYLADTFLRPTSWHDYCTQVDPFNCTLPTNVSMRGPETEEERLQFFNWPNYIGHFRKTEENDCELYPTNCTGHIADFPCHWDSFVVPQLHYLDIALKSSGPEGPAEGYPYARLVEMWKAANATRSNLIMYYWTPEALYQQFAGTDAEFIRVSMPPPSQKCQEARRLETDQCNPDFNKRIGSPDGICEESAKNLYKLVVGNLYETDLVEDAIRSPAYEALELFQMTELQLGQIFDYQREEPTPRHAVCRWIVQNMETFKTFVPRSYPRLLRDESKSRDPLVSTALVLAIVATAAVACTIYAVVRCRHLRAIRLAQIEFLYFLLAGLLLVAGGSVMVAAGGKCVVVIWFINFGYTLELVPLIVKVAAVNQLLGAARQFRRVVISRKSLFSAVFGISFCVFFFLILWTILDPPQQKPEYTLNMDDVTQDGHTVVDVSYYCSSDNLVWDYLAVGWNTLLLLCATVLAFQTRTLQKDFNESQTLAFLIYSHFIFVVLRLIIVWLQVTSNGLRSLIFSIDTLATILIYFVPKFSAAANKPQDRSSSFFTVDMSSRAQAAAAVVSQQSDGAPPERHVAFRDKSTSSSATPVHKNEAEGYHPHYSEASSSRQGGMSSTHLSTSDDDVRIPEEDEHVDVVQNDDADVYGTISRIDEENVARQNEYCDCKEISVNGEDESSEVSLDDIAAVTSSSHVAVN